MKSSNYKQGMHALHEEEACAQMDQNTVTENILFLGNCQKATDNSDDEHMDKSN